MYFLITEAKFKTDSFIFAKPCLVIPRTSPLLVIRSATNIGCRLSILIPWFSITNFISVMIVALAASIPNVRKT